MQRNEREISKIVKERLELRGKRIMIEAQGAMSTWTSKTGKKMDTHFSRDFELTAFKLKKP